ncbi:methylated-DNA--[protein]-cysteine S-methyltransferase [Bacillaceae bacterium Marseille-Q3522]|nr:methylated-DNA--[protein]-cysteine S-methyltransferase [Bacillaceae bacterium Marseille-Q3522]
MEITNIYWSTFIHPVFHNRPLYLAATKRGICRITWPHESFETLETWIRKRMPNAKWSEDDEQLSSYVRQLEEYFQGNRKAFTLPLDLQGTVFQTKVWNALLKIPFGNTQSYMDIAAASGNPKAVRAAGTAIGANPVPIIVPCHRVIGKNAALTGFRGGLNVKETLLQLEGFYDYRKKGHARFQF